MPSATSMASAAMWPTCMSTQTYEGQSDIHSEFWVSLPYWALVVLTKEQV